ncbi:MAG: glutamate N-acetyltransferase / amino-acid N-acetyltransferase, partial [Campylobacterota bacterium]|nr:glutamate N-acetyltransferase / amino-acid N-acetyltransferase [Campylobacterota bacterium]
MYNIIYSSGGVCASEGFFADGVSAGLKKDNAKDM